MTFGHSKSLRTAYVLWFVLGLFGGHRFYLGKWFTGFLYLISAGFYGIGWAIDLLLLPYMVRKVNEEAIRKRVTPRPEFAPSELAPTVAAAEPEPETPPAWTKRSSVMGVFDLPLRLLFFLFAPCFFTISAAMLEEWELLALLVVTLVVCAFLGNVESLRRRYPAIEKVPMLSHALGYLRSFTSLYRQQAPFGFLYYLFYPITAPFALLTSPGARREFKVFGRLIGAFMLIVAARIGFSYFSVFPPHLGPGEAILFFLIESILILILVVLFVIPTVTTALTLNAMQRTTQLRILVVLALVSALPMGLAYQFAVRPPLSFISAQLLEERLGKESFRKELGQSASMFLTYWSNHLTGLDKPLGEGLEINDELTRKWQRLASGICVKDEVNAMKVLSWKDSSGGPWLAIGLWTSPGESMTQLLIVAQVGGKLFTHWADLPEPTQRRFLDRPKQDAFNILLKQMLEDIRHRGLSSAPKS